MGLMSDSDLYIDQNTATGKVRIGVNLLPKLDIKDKPQSEEPSPATQQSNGRYSNFKFKYNDVSRPIRTADRLPREKKFKSHDKVLSDAQRQLAEKLAGMIENVETRNKLIREQLIVHQNLN